MTREQVTHLIEADGRIGLALSKIRTAAWALSLKLAPAERRGQEAAFTRAKLELIGQYRRFRA